ncbi:MAG TPA: DUF2203 domain-containing protein [Candidatus Limnocylindrales bacterium]|nr:DUF2203 domain-containing protein [Candidatus Limnocylindrales bacterium]
MTRYYGIDEANLAIPDVERILLDLRDQRAELIRLRDAVLAVSGQGTGAATEGAADRGAAALAGDPLDAAADLRRMRLRMQGLIDQMQAGVTRLVERDVTLREIESGLIDFPALANGRPIWLCWRLGEGDVEWWHEHDDGFAGRRRLSDLT